MSKESLIQELRGYADDPECGLTVRQVDNVRGQLFRSTIKKPPEATPDVIGKAQDRSVKWVAALSVVVMAVELARTFL